MPISYQVDSAKQLILETWDGVVDSSELARYWRHYLSDDKVLEIRRTVVDLRKAVIKFSGAELDYLIHSIVIPKLNGKKWITAIVVDKPYQFGIGRQYQVFAEYYSRDSIFSSLEDAIAWIGNESIQT
jgi:hypothetical protein